MHFLMVMLTENRYIAKAIVIRIFRILNVVHLKTTLGFALLTDMASTHQSNLLKAMPRG
jgi:hypothetical protein